MPIACLHCSNSGIVTRKVLNSYQEACSHCTTHDHKWQRHYDELRSRFIREQAKQGKATSSMVLELFGLEEKERLAIDIG